MWPTSILSFLTLLPLAFGQTAIARSDIFDAPAALQTPGPTLSEIAAAKAASKNASKSPLSGDCLNPTYKPRYFLFDWEEIGGWCYRGRCIPFETEVLADERGGGRLYQLGVWDDDTIPSGPSLPLMFEAVHQWKVINCTALRGTPEGNACGDRSKRALLSPGESPFDKRAPRVNTLNHPGLHFIWDMESVVIMPLIKDKIKSDAKVTFIGHKINGGKVELGSIMKNMERTKIKGFKEFKGIIALDITVEEFGGGNTRYPFALDDLEGIEYVKNPDPQDLSCATYTIPRGTVGPCIPSATATSTRTINADDIPAPVKAYQSQLPEAYSGIQWNMRGRNIFFYNATTIIKDNYRRIRPGPVIPPSAPNFIASYDGKLELSSLGYEDRFGVEELKILPSFPEWFPEDNWNINGAPMRVIFVGRRDPYDGSGLPALVKIEIQIPNPGNSTAQRAWTHVKLNELTKSKGGFNNLVRFNVYSELGDTEISRAFAFDDLVVTKEEGVGTKCRVPGASTLTFDDLPRGPFPNGTYKGFKAASVDAWEVVSRNSYPVNSPGHNASISAPNALANLRPLNEFTDTGLDSYISPIENFLFDLESITLTLNITNLTRLNEIEINVVTMDACGDSSTEASVQPLWLKTTSSRRYWFTPTAQQMVLAVPAIAISKYSIFVSWKYGTPESSDPAQYRPQFWVDDVKYRKHKMEGPLPGCRRCSNDMRYGWCEYPMIQR